MASTPPVCDFNWKAPAFSLPGTDGATHTYDSIKGPKGALIVFMCNHCPFVKSILPRLVRDAKDLKDLGIGVAAISANDATSHPDDGFDAMKQVTTDNAFPFPYLYDETQDVARAYDAICTPDFFGFNADGGLQYRGRLDESRTKLVPDARRDLFEAMKLVAETGAGPSEQIPSMGCSIKWKT